MQQVRHLPHQALPVVLLGGPLPNLVLPDFPGSSAGSCVAEGRKTPLDSRHGQPEPNTVFEFTDLGTTRPGETLQVLNSCSGIRMGQIAFWHPTTRILERRVREWQSGTRHCVSCRLRNIDVPRFRQIPQGMNNICIHMMSWMASPFCQGGGARDPGHNAVCLARRARNRRAGNTNRVPIDCPCVRMGEHKPHASNHEALPNADSQYATCPCGRGRKICPGNEHLTAIICA